MELLSYSGLGIEMGAAVGIGVAIGWWLDHRIEWTSPWLTMFFMAMGLAAAAKAFIRTARRMREKTRDKGEGGPQ